MMTIHIFIGNSHLGKSGNVRSVAVQREYCIGTQKSLSRSLPIMDDSSTIFRILRGTTGFKKECSLSFLRGNNP